MSAQTEGSWLWRTTPTSVAVVLRCSKWCVYELINTGALKSIRLGRAIRVTRRALEELLAIRREPFNRARLS
ncbi:MAG TPA: helix-turn-helix domain-containing protein [Acidimicrobiales bacterium]